MSHCNGGYCGTTQCRCLCRECRGPQWTTALPTEPGWYWARGKGVLEVVQVSRYLEHKQIGLPPKPVIVAWVFGDECERELHEWSHWLRIDAPEVPK